MLGYRSYFSVAGAEPGDTIPLASGQLHAWLRSKNLDADLLVPGPAVEIGDRAHARLTIEKTQDGGESIRFALRETQPVGDWVTQLVIHDPRHGREQPWVWLDVDAPPSADGDNGQPRWTASPRLARELLEVLDGRDHGARLNPNVETIREDDVDALVEVLAAPGRRGPVFVAGSDPSLPMHPWRELVGKLLQQTTGLAAGYVLNPDATALFAELVGHRHAVPAGTMRTFLRGMDIGSDLDAYRHRLLTTERIVSHDTNRMIRVLGTRARDLTLEEPVPRAALRTLDRLLALADEAPAARSTATRTPSDVSAVGDVAALVDIKFDSPAHVSELNLADAYELADTQAQVEVAEVEEYLALVAALRPALGGMNPTPDSLAALAQDAADARHLRAAVERKERQSAELTVMVEVLRDDLARATRRLEDEQLEHRSTFDVLTTAENERHALRMRLQSAGLKDAAWTPPSKNEVAATAPESFGELLKRIDTLDYVEFTGDSSTSEELDIRDPLGTWAAKSWSALCALDDYVQCRIDGRHSGSVEMYLGDTPAGCAGYSTNRHARDESEDVRTNAKYRTARELPVPKSIDASGSVFMGAHFKIAQSGTISPRLHYHDAFDTEKRVYVGYIGRHLPTQKTN